MNDEIQLLQASCLEDEFVWDGEDEQITKWKVWQIKYREKYDVEKMTLDTMTTSEDGYRFKLRVKVDPEIFLFILMPPLYPGDIASQLLMNNFFCLSIYIDIEAEAMVTIRGDTLSRDQQVISKSEYHCWSIYRKNCLLSFKTDSLNQNEKVISSIFLFIFFKITFSIESFSF